MDYNMFRVCSDLLHKCKPWAHENDALSVLFTLKVPTDAWESVMDSFQAYSDACARYRASLEMMQTMLKQRKEEFDAAAQADVQTLLKQQKEALDVVAQPEVQS
jgi:hypothetical protein